MDDRNETGRITSPSLLNMLPSLARRYSSKTRPKAPRKLAAVQSAHVRLWDTVKIRDVAHLVQAIEQKYGKILEFKCGRVRQFKYGFSTS